MTREAQIHMAVGAVVGFFIEAILITTVCVFSEDIDTVWRLLVFSQDTLWSVVRLSWVLPFACYLVLHAMVFYPDR
jgi:hypothetical protein